MSSDRIEPKPSFKAFITEQCDSCLHCVKAFQCPAIIFNELNNKVTIDTSICVGCGQCIPTCERKYIIRKQMTDRIC